MKIDSSQDQIENGFVTLSDMIRGELYISGFHNPKLSTQPLLLGLS
jgi:hypothetical protein